MSNNFAGELRVSTQLTYRLTKKKREKDANRAILTHICRQYLKKYGRYKIEALYFDESDVVAL